MVSRCWLECFTEWNKRPKALEVWLKIELIWLSYNDFKIFLAIYAMMAFVLQSQSSLKKNITVMNNLIPFHRNWVRWRIVFKHRLRISTLAMVRAHLRQQTFNIPCLISVSSLICGVLIYAINLCRFTTLILCNFWAMHNDRLISQFSSTLL